MTELQQRLHNAAPQHDFKQTNIAEWSDTWTCQRCGLSKTLAAEDLADARTLNGTVNPPCQADLPSPPSSEELLKELASAPLRQHVQSSRLDGPLKNEGWTLHLTDAQAEKLRQFGRFFPPALSSEPL